MNDITLYDENGLPVTLDLSELSENQKTIISQNETLIQHNKEMLQKADEQIEIENTLVNFCGFTFIILAAIFVYRLINSVLSF